MEHLIECGDTLELIKQVDLESIDLIATSPPYWAKRIYNGVGLTENASDVNYPWLKPPA